jgi:MoaA/NifB/PqqE/SkfB family radical SAM enzyme
MKAALYKGLTHVLSRALRTPPYLILFVSDSCWMKCRHCWFSEDWKAANLRRKTAGGAGAGLNDRTELVRTHAVDYTPLTLDEIERMAASMPRVVFLTLTGGEAFMRRDIVDIVDVFARRTKLWRYQIPTSGFVTDMIVEKAARMLERHPSIPFRVDVSLDGTEETHERVRNVAGGFARACTTVRELVRLRRKHLNLDVGIITTISKDNQHEVPAIARLAEELNPEGEWMVNVTRGRPRDPAALEVDPENYLFAHKLIKRRIEERRYRGHGGHSTGPWLTAKNATRRRMIHDTLTGRRKGGGCSAGALSGVIYSDGTVRPCELLDHTIGNVRDFGCDLAELWASPAADRIRRWIQDTRCICTQECFLSMDILIQPGRWPQLLGERLKLLGADRNLATASKAA